MFWRSNEKGFSLIEIMVAAGLLGVVALACTALMVNVLNVQNGMSISVQAYELKNKVMYHFQKDVFWEATIQANRNIDVGDALFHFNSLQIPDVSPPMNPPPQPTSFPFQILAEGTGASPTVWYDSGNANAGFTRAGFPCSSFNQTNPDGSRNLTAADDCPFRYTFMWSPICPGTGPDCPNPGVRVTGTFQVQFGNIRKSLDPRNYSFTISVGSPLVDLKRNCHRLGGQWDDVNGKCIYLAQLCRDPDRPLFTGFNPDNTPSCREVIKTGNALETDGAGHCGWDQVVRGVLKDGTMICGQPLKARADGVYLSDASLKCPDGQRQIASYGDGVPVCEDIHRTAEVDDGRGRYSCNSGEKVVKTFTNGKFLCGPTVEDGLDVGQGAVTQCNAGQKVVAIYKNGQVKCGDLNDVSDRLNCRNPNEVVISVNANGTVNCGPPIVGGTCQAGARVFGVNRDGWVNCQWVDCVTGDQLLYYDTNSGEPICQHTQDAPPVYDYSNNIPNRRWHWFEPVYCRQMTHASVPLWTKMLDPAHDGWITDPVECRWLNNGESCHYTPSGKDFNLDGHVDGAGTPADPHHYHVHAFNNDNFDPNGGDSLGVTSNARCTARYRRPYNGPIIDIYPW